MGKSLMYQGLAIGFARKCMLVVSPLTALMEDQVKAAQGLGITAISLDSEYGNHFYLSEYAIKVASAADSVIVWRARDWYGTTLPNVCPDVLDNTDISVQAGMSNITSRTLQDGMPPRHPSGYASHQTVKLRRLGVPRMGVPQQRHKKYLGLNTIAPSISFSDFEFSSLNIMTINDVELGLQPRTIHPSSGTRGIESEVLRKFEKCIGEIYRIDDGGKIPAKIISLKSTMSGCRESHFSQLGVLQSLVTFNEGEHSICSQQSYRTCCNRQPVFRKLLYSRPIQRSFSTRDFTKNTVTLRSLFLSVHGY